jgi:hypothetical protein
MWKGDPGVGPANTEMGPLSRDRHGRVHPLLPDGSRVPGGVWLPRHPRATWKRRPGPVSGIYGRTGTSRGVPPAVMLRGHRRATLGDCAHRPARMPSPRGAPTGSGPGQHFHRGDPRTVHGPPSMDPGYPLGAGASQWADAWAFSVPPRFRTPQIAGNFSRGV